MQDLTPGLRVCLSTDSFIALDPSSTSYNTEHHLSLNCNKIANSPILISSYCAFEFDILRFE